MILLIVAIVIVLGFDLISFRNLKSMQDKIKVPVSNLFTIPKVSKSETSIILLGDIMLGRSVMETSLFTKGSPVYPFEKVSDILNKANIVFGNLENPIISNCPRSTSGLKFCTDPKMIAGLESANINIVNLANNHARNYGEEGFKETENYLRDNEIDYVGANNLVVRKIGNTSFGFLGFNFVGSKPSDLDLQLISDSKNKVDTLIIMVHWGIEYSPHPTENQKTIAKDLVSGGADIVVGSHPHWVQDIEFIDGKPIFYSLGNFVFDQAWSEETKSGLAIRLTYQEGELSKIEELPIYMKNFTQPEWSSPPQIIWPK